MAGLGVAGRRVESEQREHHLHIDEVIVQANRHLANPETFGVQQSPEMKSLRHLNLDSNHMFLALKRQLGKYYEEKQSLKSTLHPEKSEKWKEVLYASLLRALMELTFAVDKDQQLSALNHIYKWYMDKTRIDLPQLPRSIVKPTHSEVKPTTVVSQDNTMKARRERMLVRQMDAVRSIESRSPSPPRTASTQEHLQPLFAQRLVEDYQEEKVAGLFLDSREREMTEGRSSQVHHKLMTKWAMARSRLDERLLSKAENSAIKPNIQLAAIQPVDVSEEEADSDSENIASTRPVQTTKARRSVPTYVDLRDRTRTASLLGELEADQREEFKALTKVERSRLLNNSVIQTRTGSVAQSPDRLSLSFYGSVKPGHYSSRSYTPGSAPQSEDKKRHTLLIADIRRKLAARQIPCTYRTLSVGLTRPDDLPTSLLTSHYLPTGGEYLTSNPFSSLGKKKGKKKSKKR